MQIKDFEEGNEKQILDLFEKSFGKRLSLKYWLWRFKNNPVGQHLVKLMWDDERLVGHYAVSPLSLNVQETKKHGALSMTTMTDPCYNGRGIFKDLANALYEDLELKYEHALVMGFPNNNSHYGFIKKLHWRNLGILSHLIKEAGTIKPEKSLNVRLAGMFREEHSSILEKISGKFSLSVNKSVEYLNWRYIENPEEQYFLFEFIDNDFLKGFLVVKLYPSETIGRFNLFIVENGIPVENVAYLSDLLSHLEFCFSPCLDRIYTWLPLFDERYVFYERNGFIPGGRPTYMGVRDLTGNDTFSGDIRNWYYSYGDSDIY